MRPKFGLVEIRKKFGKISIFKNIFILSLIILEISALEPKKGNEPQSTVHTKGNIEDQSTTGIFESSNQFANSVPNVTKSQVETPEFYSKHQKSNELEINRMGNNGFNKTKGLLGLKSSERDFQLSDDENGNLRYHKLVDDGNKTSINNHLSDDVNDTLNYFQLSDENETSFTKDFFDFAPYLVNLPNNLQFGNADDKILLPNVSSNEDKDKNFENYEQNMEKYQIDSTNEAVESIVSSMANVENKEINKTLSHVGSGSEVDNNQSKTSQTITENKNQKEEFKIALHESDNPEKSEIVSMRTAPKKFLEIFKKAQQSKGFEDPFKLSSLFLNHLGTDSTGVLSSKDSHDTAPFRANKASLYQNRFDDDGMELFHSPISKLKPNNPEYLASGNNKLDSDVLEIASKLSNLHNIDLKNNKSKNYSEEYKNTQNRPIYEELSSSLHVDTSIDDIANDFESSDNEKEDLEAYIIPVNASITDKIILLSKNQNSKTFDTKINKSSAEMLTPTNDSDKNPNIYLPMLKNEINNTSEDISPLIFVNSETNTTEISDIISTTVSGRSKSNNNNTQNSNKIDKNGKISAENIKWKNNDVSQNLKEEPLSKNPKPMNQTDKNLKKSVLDWQAERMSSLMNASVDPCHDFYEFACGRWPDTYQRRDKAVDNTFDRLRENLDWKLKELLEQPVQEHEPKWTTSVKTLYKGCMNEDKIEAAGVDPLLGLVEELGGWPMIIGKTWNETEFDWVELMAKLKSMNNDVLLSEWVAADVNNSSYHVVHIDQPKLGLPSRDYFLSRGDQTYRAAYVDLMLKATQIMGATDPLRAFEDAMLVLQFEKRLSQILTSSEHRKNLAKAHKRMTLNQLIQEIPQINWPRYFQIILGTEMEADQEILVFALPYIKRLVKLVKITEKRTVSNYLLWRFVKNRLKNLGQEAQKAKQEFNQILFGTKASPERWVSCVSFVNGNLGQLVGSLFVQKYYSETSKNDSEEIALKIRNAFIEAIRKADWMKLNTREIAEKKITKMIQNIGYPEYIMNNTYMELAYNELQFNESNHFDNAMELLQYHARVTHSLLGTPVKKEEWATTPGVVNAYYSRSKNMIMFPAGILQPPFYSPAFPRSLNFGGIGVVIGHEISHGFDDRGRQFDENGNLHQWWTEEDVSRFYDRATCLLDQYNSYRVSNLQLKINAVNTLGENIADNAGLKISYKAFKKWKEEGDAENGQQFKSFNRLNLTDDQLFFLNFGQIWCEESSPKALLTKIRSGQHSPNKYRVIGTLSNSKEFIEAFKCPANSRMNSKEKCQVW